MCHYRLYIFLTCGHTSPSATPIRPCAAMRAKNRTFSAAQPILSKESERRDSAHPLAGSDTLDADAHTFQPTHSDTLIPDTDPSPQEPESEPEANDTCPISTHPYQTLNIHTACLPCQRRRSALLERLEAEKGAVRFEDWRCKVRYRVSGEGISGEGVSGGGFSGKGVSGEGRSSVEWGRSVGEAMGSWVRKRGEEVRRVLGEEGVGRRSEEVGVRGGVGSM